ncbi:prostasin [Ambystoma mexicanum]|uniref:prostasin n=1 Tax=Ambystoma mexicanum TaxID=8296 RepID=UPI0037E8B691
MPSLPGTLAAVLTLLLQQGACDLPPEEASHSRIVGGISADVGDWPWQVSVTYLGVHVCGGSLISKTRVLSAAHCFPGDHSLGNYLINLGCRTLGVPDPNMVSRTVDKVETYLDYEAGGSGDIALLTLSSPVDPSDAIKPIALPCSTTVFPVGMQCTVTGWGNIGISAPLPYPMYLQAALVPIMSRRTCKCLFSINPSSNQPEVMPDMLCAGTASGTRDACQGDSGGPLSCLVGDTYYQAGVVSWGDDCGAPNRVGVYIQTSTYSDWIASIAPDAQILCPTIDITPAPEPEGGCLDADGQFHASGASSVLLVGTSLPFYFLTVHLLSAL